MVARGCSVKHCSENLTKILKNTLAIELYFCSRFMPKVDILIKKRILAHVFFCGFCEILSAPPSACSRYVWKLSCKELEIPEKNASNIKQKVGTFCRTEVLLYKKWFQIYPVVARPKPHVHNMWYSHARCYMNILSMSNTIFLLTGCRLACQPAITCSKLTIETLQQGGKYVQI